MHPKLGPVTMTGAPFAPWLDAAAQSCSQARVLGWLQSPWKPAGRSPFHHWQFLQAGTTKDVPHFLASMMMSPHPTPALVMWLMSLLASINNPITFILDVRAQEPGKRRVPMAPLLVWGSGWPGRT